MVRTIKTHRDLDMYQMAFAAAFKKRTQIAQIHADERRSKNIKNQRKSAKISAHQRYQRSKIENADDADIRR